jgi:hypothetical protein
VLISSARMLIRLANEYTSAVIIELCWMKCVWHSRDVPSPRQNRDSRARARLVSVSLGLGCLGWGLGLGQSRPQAR